MTAVFEKLGIEYDTLKDWNCCGATSAHALDHKLYMSLNLRNLALAQDQG
jgi:heterodisulfide reductase subunit B